MTFEAQELRNREAAESSTISITACPTCGALAQSIGSGEGVIYRHVDTVHSAYDFIRKLYSVTFGDGGDEFSIPELCEKLLAKAEIL